MKIGDHFVTRRVVVRRRRLVERRQPWIDMVTARPNRDKRKVTTNRVTQLSGPRKLFRLDDEKGDGHAPCPRSAGRSPTMLDLESRNLGHRGDGASYTRHLRALALKDIENRRRRSDTRWAERHDVRAPVGLR